MHRHSWFNSNIVSSRGVICFSITGPIGWGVPLSSNCRDDRMMVVIIVITQPLFLPMCESRRPTLCGFVPQCEKYHSFLKPPSPAWISGMWHSTKALLGYNRAPVWMCHIPVGAVVFIRPLILSLWAGLVGVIITTQPKLSQTWRKRTKKVN